VRGDLLVREQEMLDLVVEHRFEVIERDLVPTLLAGVLPGIRRNVHLLTTVAVRHPREEVDGRFRYPLELGPLLGEVVVALGPQFLGDDGLDLKVYPLGLRLEYPGTLAA
jgi:hypothetical protein